MPDTTTPLRRRIKWIADVAGIILLILAAKTAIAEPFYVPSGSMEPTLQIGDALVATKFPYGYSASSLALPFGLTPPRTQRILGGLPDRGEVVVFRWPGDRAQVWVKRVIGLPGDRIQMRDGRLRINGAFVGLRADGTGEIETESGARMPARRFTETLPGGREHPIFKIDAHGALDDTPEITVPAGRVFVMGDNRDNSADSRLPVAEGGVGLLPAEDVVGRVVGIVGSWDLAVRQQPVWNWPSGLRLARFFTGVQ